MDLTIIAELASKLVLQLRVVQRGQARAQQLVERLTMWGFLRACARVLCVGTYLLMARLPANHVEPRKAVSVALV